QLKALLHAHVVFTFTHVIDAKETVIAHALRDDFLTLGVDLKTAHERFVGNVRKNADVKVGEGQAFALIIAHLDHFLEASTKIVGVKELFAIESNDRRHHDLACKTGDLPCDPTIFSPIQGDSVFTLPRVEFSNG